MKRSNRLLILLGVFLAVAGGLGTVILISGSGGGNGGNGGNNGVSSASPTPTPEPLTTVVIAKQDINLGDKITAAMVDTKKLTISAQQALGTDTFSDVSQVIGKVAGGNIASGQVLLASRDFLPPGTVPDGQDIASLVGTGMRGVVVEVDQVNGVGTLLVPGDHVDVIVSAYMDQIALSATNSNKTTISLPGGSRVTTKTVIQNRKVLITLLAPLDTTANAAPTPATSGAPVAGPTQPVVQNTGRHMLVVLEVKPDEAEILRWAQREEGAGTQNYIDLSLSLRSDKDNELPDATTPGITFKMLVDKYGVLPLDPRGVLPPDLAKGISW
ncbi:MAG TPA: Flp pilus assembly protein CpaB [Candidatus Limnocylindrales bacterium]|nr:Flp pilus assembly protein CpaB [Candidatus Limnocylindrales bacterium]